MAYARLGKDKAWKAGTLVSRVVKTEINASPLKELSSASQRSCELSADLPEDRPGDVQVW